MRLPELIREREALLLWPSLSPFRSAEKFWVEEIIDPRKTRSLLCEFARLAEPLRKPGVATGMRMRP